MFWIGGPGMPGGRVRLRFPVYFVRHGQTDWNAARRFQGHSDIPLNDTGRAQAARNGDALAKAIRNPDKFDYFTSPLSRACETLEIIRERLELPRKRFTVDDRLIEIDLGDWNGKTVEEIKAQGDGAWERRQAAKWDFVVPGGESYAEAAERTRDFLLSLKGPALIAGHGASGRLLRGYLRGIRRNAVAYMRAPQDIAHKLERGRETII